MTMQLFFKDNLKFSAFPPPPIGFLNIDAHMYQIDSLAPFFIELHIKIKIKVLIAGYSCLPLVRQQNLKRFTAPVKSRPRNNCDSMH